MVIHDSEKYNLQFVDAKYLRIFIKENVELGVEEMDDLLAIYSSILNNKKVPFLVVFDEFAHITQEARGMIANENRCEFKQKEAVVVKSLSQRLLIDFVINYHTTPHPTRIFNSEEKAMLWINQSIGQAQSTDAISA